MTATMYRSASADGRRSVTGGSEADTAWARLLVSGASLTVFLIGLLGLVFDAADPRTVGLASYLLFGMGAAPWVLARRMGLGLRLALSAGGSLSVLILVSIVMLLADAWHPMILAAIVFAVTVPVHACGLFVAVRERPAWATTPRPLGRPALAMALSGGALCLVAALTHRHINPGLWGFLAQIGPLWYVGLGLILVSLATARSTDEVTLAVGVLLLMLVLTGTPALTYDGPRSQSASKHLEFVQQIRQHHYLHSTIAVYNSWPGYFSAMAWLADVAGIKDPVGLATAWPLLVGLVRIPTMRFFAGQVMKGKTLPWLAVGIGVLADPIGADYFSPQAVGFVLGLLIFGIALSKMPLWPKIAIMTVIGSAVTVAHQLSPYIIGGTLCVLVVFRQLRPGWTPITVLGPAGIWAATHWKDLSHFLTFGEVGNANNFKPPSTSITPGLHRLPIVTYTVAALVFGVLIVAVIALVALIQQRTDARTWAMAMCPAVGLAIVAVNPYGNEGIFRAALFGLPWLSVLAAQAFRRNDMRRLSVPLLAVVLALSATFGVAAFGLDATNVLRPEDRTTLHLFLAADPGSDKTDFLLVVGPGDLPSSPPTFARTHVAVRRSDFDKTGFVLNTAPPSTMAARITDGYVKYVATQAVATQANVGHLYMIWSPVSSYYGWEYGIHTQAQFAALRDAFGQSTKWKVAYSRGGSVLFLYTPTGS